MKFPKISAFALLPCTVLFAWAADTSAPAKETPAPPSGTPPKIHNRQVTAFVENDRHGLRLDAREGDGVAWWPESTLANGTIEFDARGKDVLQKSFLGVAFHGLDEKTYDAVYFRPFNFKATNPERHSHGVQYISHPDYPWFKLRQDRPGVFEHEVTPAPDPTGWFHVRIVIEHPTVRVFVNNEEKPALTIKQLSTRKTGWVGIWAGNGSDGDFANLKLTPAP